MRTLPGRDLSADVASLAAESGDVPLAEAYAAVRRLTEALAAPLSPEDQVVQSMPDASPAKWHLAHTTWFFETFLLLPYLPGWRVFDERWGFLFNSYYEAVGARHPRPQRGLLTRPSVAEVARYRAAVDVAMAELLSAPARRDCPDVAALVRLGINHEQQHQELLLTDILHAFSCNPLRPSYRSFHADPPLAAAPSAAPLAFVAFPGGLREIGADGRSFAFDNESPCHTVYLRPFRLAERPVSNGDWLAFIDGGGYLRPELWLSDGWATVQAEAWRAPLYWQRDGDAWSAMTLAGPQPLDPAAPVCHVSFYEADAYARWMGKRLPSEAEWEFAAGRVSAAGNLLDAGAPQRSPLRPLPGPAAGSGKLRQLFGDVWEWTQSPYAPYPGFRPAAGAVGEYNGKFMCNQMVLRGGSCVTPAGHVRASYRNFFYPHQRWQFAGLRLAEDV